MKLTALDKYDRFDYVTEELNGKFGVIHRNGQRISGKSERWMIPPVHDMVHVIESDIVHIGDGDHYCLTDRYGQLLCKVDFNRIRRLYWLGNYYAVRKDGKWAVADGEFNLLTDYIYDDCRSQPGDLIYVRTGDEWKLVLVYDCHGLPLRSLEKYNAKI